MHSNIHHLSQLIRSQTPIAEASPAEDAVGGPMAGKMTGG
jgi:hypothetical protein